MRKSKNTFDLFVFFFFLSFCMGMGISALTNKHDNYFRNSRFCLILRLSLETFFLCYHTISFKIIFISINPISGYRRFNEQFHYVPFIISIIIKEKNFNLFIFLSNFHQWKRKIACSLVE